MVTNEKIFKSLLGLSEIGHNKCPKTKSQKYFWESIAFLKESLKKSTILRFYRVPTRIIFFIAMHKLPPGLKIVNKFFEIKN